MRMVMSIVASMFILLLIPETASAVTRFGEKLCQDNGYTCYNVAKGDTWEKLFPDAQQRAIVMRINRMNVPVRPGMMIAIPAQKDHWDYMAFAPFAKQIEPTGNKTIIVDPTQLAWGAYDENGNLVRWGPMAGGKSWCSDIQNSCRTAIGTFAVYREGGSNCKSSKFPVPDGGAPMPYCMFFKGGYAIHASSEVPGYSASHGCVRVFYEDAQWLNEDFVQLGTKVIVRPYVV